MTRPNVRTKPPIAPILLLGLFAGLLAALTSCGRGGDAQPALTAAEADTLMKSYAKDRSDTETWLKSSPTRRSEHPSCESHINPPGVYE